MHILQLVLDDYIERGLGGAIEMLCTQPRYVYMYVCMYVIVCSVLLFTQPGCHVVCVNLCAYVIVYVCVHVYVYVCVCVCMYRAWGCCGNVVYTQPRCVYMYVCMYVIVYV